MVIEENLLGNLPTELIIEIFSRLPSKSIARFRCLSKQWASILTSNSPYFTELFLTQSKTRPSLLFFVKRQDSEWCLYSCPQPQISYKNSESSLSVTAEYLMTLHKCKFLSISPPILGLIYCFNMLDYDGQMLCNPTTRNLLLFPKFWKRSYSYFGYDPIDKQFSVLSIGYPMHSPNYQILKLGSGRVSWRNIECPLRHYPLQDNICINGILYYTANYEVECPRKIVCFDLNSEEFKFVDVPWPRWYVALVNFKGKLGGIRKNRVRFGEDSFSFELSLWVLEDVKTQEWSKHVYLLPASSWYTKRIEIYIIGLTATGDVVLYLSSTTLNRFCVYFFNLEKNTLQKVEIKGFEKLDPSSFFQCFVDYVEDLKDINCS